jgi:hypothetical protein
MRDNLLLIGSALVVCLLKSASAQVPEAVMKIPRNLGICSSLYLDLTLSTGSGGIPWNNITIAVNSSSPNITALNVFLKQNDKSLSTRPLEIPSSLLEAPHSYSFTVILCNTMLHCGRTTQTVTTLTSLLPTVSIAGLKVRSVVVNQALSLSSVATLTNCDEPSSRAGLTYLWKVLNSTGSILQISSTSRDPSKFIIPPYSFKINEVYFIELSVIYQGMTSSDSIEVIVVSGVLIPIIQGGSHQTVRLGSLLKLDGSRSYDENRPNTFGIDARLSYFWTCSQSLPIVSGECNGIQPLLDSIVISTPFPGYSEFLIKMTIFDFDKARNSSMTVTVTFLHSLLSPVINLQSNALFQEKINSEQTFIITGNVSSIPFGLFANLSWSVDSSNDLNLDDSALTPLTAGVLPQFTPQFVLFNLKLNSNSLRGGLTYAFTLTCTLEHPGPTSSLSISVTVNSPPSPGSFTVIPKNGIELVTSFTFACNLWQDDNLPLQYQFIYITSSENSMTLQSMSESTSTSQTLPSESFLANYELVCAAYIFDGYLAHSTAFFSIFVIPVLNPSLHDIFHQKEADLLSPVLNLVKPAIATVSSILNQVNYPSASSYREKTLHAIANVTSIEPFSAFSLSSWIDNLLEITLDRQQLATTELLLALNITDNIVCKFQDSPTPIPSSSISQSIFIFDNIAKQILKATTPISTRVAVLFHDSVKRYSIALATSMVIGENPFHQITDTVKITTQRIGLQSFVPTMDIRKSGCLLKLPLPSDDFIGGSYYVSAFTLSSKLYSSLNIESDILSLFISSSPGGRTFDDSCSVTVVLKWNFNESSPVNATHPVDVPASFNTTCFSNDYSSHFYQCPNGLNVTVSCSGFSQIISSSCPIKFMVPICKVFQDGIVMNSGCFTVGLTSENITCICPFLPFLNGSTSMGSQEISMTFAASHHQTIGPSLSTIISAGVLTINLDTNVLPIIPFLIVCCLPAIVAILMTISYLADRKERSRIAMEETVLQNTRFTKLNSIKQSYSRHPEDATNLQQQQSEIRSRSDTLSSLMEEALPQILSSQLLWEKIWNETRRHHKWIAIIYYFSLDYPRILRIVSLATNIIISLFIQALTFGLSEGDDGTCERLMNEAACLVPRSSYGTGGSKCYWTPATSSNNPSPNGGKCSFIQPNDELKITLFVAIFSALASIPMSVFCDWLINRILAAPLSSSYVSILPFQEKNNGSNIKLTAIRPVDSTFEIKAISSVGISVNDNLTSMIDSDISRLKRELVEYASTLSDKEANEFKGTFMSISLVCLSFYIAFPYLLDLWGLDRKHEFLIKESHSVEATTSRKNSKKYIINLVWKN